MNARIYFARERHKNIPQSDHLACIGPLAVAVDSALALAVLALVVSIVWMILV